MEMLASLRRVAEVHGGSLGISGMEPFHEEHEQITSRVAEGLHGGLGFTYADPELAANPATTFPWAESIVVLALPYLAEGDGVLPVATGQRTVARFADGDRYGPLHDVLSEIEGLLCSAGHRTEVVVDDRRLIDRAVATRSGVAWPGKSTMVLTPGAGPWILIGSIVTDALLRATEPMRRTCGTCEACMPACPTGAIIAPGVLDARRCLAAVFQRRGAVDPELRKAAGGRVYGCDACLVVCPPGIPGLRALSAGRVSHDPRQLLSMNDRDLDALTAHWYVPSRNMRFVRRNALVALGNTGSVGDVAVLAGYLGHPDGLLAQHAAWAIGAIGGEVAGVVLAAALLDDPSDELRAELDAALAT